MIDLEQLVSVRQASRRLEVHEETIRRLLRSGALQGEKLGAQWFIPKDKLVAFANAYDPKTGRRRKLI